jgi:hypothetical protein
MNWKNIGILIFAITSLTMIVSCQKGQEITETENSTPQNLLPQNTPTQDAAPQDPQPQSSALFKTTFDYSAECSQRGNLGNATCESVENDGIYWDWGANLVGGHATEAVSAANNPDGDGGLGFRSWVGDGTNVMTGEARIDFPSPQKELWIRWYQRYEAGFAWSGGEPHYDKTFYINTEGSLAIHPQHAGNGKWSLTIQGGGETYQATTNPALTWTDVFGPTSDGLFHLFEVHIKLDTNSSDGVGQMWIDGNLVIDASGVDFSGGSSASRDGITWMEFHANQNSPANGGPAYVDYDDIEMWDTMPPATDANGNPWIGPINDITSISGG